MAERLAPINRTIYLPADATLDEALAGAAVRRYLPSPGGWQVVTVPRDWSGDGFTPGTDVALALPHVKGSFATDERWLQFIVELANPDPANRSALRPLLELVATDGFLSPPPDDEDAALQAMRRHAALPGLFAGCMRNTDPGAAVALAMAAFDTLVDAALDDQRAEREAALAERRAGGRIAILPPETGAERTTELLLRDGALVVIGLRGEEGSLVVPSSLADEHDGFANVTALAGKWQREASGAWRAELSGPELNIDALLLLAYEVIGWRTSDTALRISAADIAAFPEALRLTVGHLPRLLWLDGPIRLANAAGLLDTRPRPIGDSWYRYGVSAEHPGLLLVQVAASREFDGDVLQALLRPRRGGAFAQSDDAWIGAAAERLAEPSPTFAHLPLVALFTSFPPWCTTVWLAMGALNDPAWLVPAVAVSAGILLGAFTIGLRGRALTMFGLGAILLTSALIISGSADVGAWSGAGALAALGIGGARAWDINRRRRPRAADRGE
jgi:hypothetical protein